VDNISMLCRSGKENEAEAWLPVQGWALRQRAQKRSVLFIHHSGKGGAQRGTSKREDVLDTVINLRRPPDYNPEAGAAFEIHFEKNRGFYGKDAKPFEARLITDEEGKQIWAMKSLDECNYERIIRLLNEGSSQQEIAEELRLSKSTVSYHARRAKKAGKITAGDGAGEAK
jgi:putative DNA primase/helicase